MPRPKNKSELLQLSAENSRQLLDHIDKLGPKAQQLEFPPGTLNRNIRDVITHLHHWHTLFLDWYRIGMSGAKPLMPAKGYSWKTLPYFNQWIWRNYQSVNLAEALVSFKSSFDEVRKIIEAHSDEELFEKKRYKWTGSTSLASYLISATSSHYQWGLKLIKRAIKRLETNSEGNR